MYDLLPIQPMSLSPASLAIFLSMIFALWPCSFWNSLPVVRYDSSCLIFASPVRCSCFSFFACAHGQGGAWCGA